MALILIQCMATNFSWQDLRKLTWNLTTTGLEADCHSHSYHLNLCYMSHVFGWLMFTMGHAMQFWLHVGTAKLMVLQLFSTCDILCELIWDLPGSFGQRKITTNPVRSISKVASPLLCYSSPSQSPFLTHKSSIKASSASLFSVCYWLEGGCLWPL